MNQIQCMYCGKTFEPSLYHPNQKVCNRKACQRKRQADYHRHKIITDEEYRLTCQDSKKKWREQHPEYDREYRKKHPSVIKQNRLKQRTRDRYRKHRQTIQQLDTGLLQESHNPVCVMKFQKQNLDKNNLAFPELVVFKGVQDIFFTQNLDKNTLAFTPNA